MRKVTIGLIQGSFRSSFDEKVPELRKQNEYSDILAHDDFQYNQGTLLNLILDAVEEGAELVVCKSRLKSETVKRRLKSVTPTTTFSRNLRIQIRSQFTWRRRKGVYRHGVVEKHTT